MKKFALSILAVSMFHCGGFDLQHFQSTTPALLQTTAAIHQDQTEHAEEAKVGVETSTPQVKEDCFTTGKKTPYVDSVFKDWSHHLRFTALPIVEEKPETRTLPKVHKPWWISSDPIEPGKFLLGGQAIALKLNYQDELKKRPSVAKNLPRLTLTQIPFTEEARLPSDVDVVRLIGWIRLEERNPSLRKSATKEANNAIAKRGGEGIEWLHREDYSLTTSKVSLMIHFHNGFSTLTLQPSEKEIEKQDALYSWSLLHDWMQDGRVFDSGPSSNDLERLFAPALQEGNLTFQPTGIEFRSKDVKQTIGCFPIE